LWEINSDIKPEVLHNNPQEKENYSPVLKDLKDTSVEEDVPQARRRRSSFATLEWKESPGGREVEGPRLEGASTQHRRHRP
jgi:hypothetical protein